MLRATLDTYIYRVIRARLGACVYRVLRARHKLGLGVRDSASWSWLAEPNHSYLGTIFGMYISPSPSPSPNPPQPGTIIYRVLWARARVRCRVLVRVRAEVSPSLASALTRYHLRRV